jgi:hypothetical protein
MNSFEQAIKTYLDNRAKEDELFAKTYAKPNKSIDECCKYILQEARKRGNAVAMTDEEVYGMAVHYYDEDSIKVTGATPQAKVTTPQATPVTKPKPKSDIPNLFDQPQEQVKSAPKLPLKKKADTTAQLSLF